MTHNVKRESLMIRAHARRESFTSISMNIDGLEDSAIKSFVGDEKKQSLTASASTPVSEVEEICVPLEDLLATSDDIAVVSVASSGGQKSSTGDGGDRGRPRTIKHLSENPTLESLAETLLFQGSLAKRTGNVFVRWKKFIGVVGPGRLYIYEVCDCSSFPSLFSKFLFYTSLPKVIARPRPLCL